MKAKVDRVEISDTYFSIEVSDAMNLNIKSIGKIYLILEDGTKVDVGPKLSASFEESTGEFSVEGYLKTLVDADKVKAVEFWNEIIELK